jgi:hypothetical protein
MNTRLFLFICTIGLIPAVFLQSCSKDAEQASVDIKYTPARIYFSYTPLTLKASEVILYSGFVKVNLDSLLSANGISIGSVENPMFTKFSVTITSPQEANFAWLQAARAVISDNIPDSWLGEIGDVVNGGGTGKTIILQMHYNIISFGVKGFSLTVYATLTGPVPYQWLQMYIDSELKMTLNPI